MAREVAVDRVAILGVLRSHFDLEEYSFLSERLSLLTKKLKSKGAVRQIGAGNFSDCGEFAVKIPGRRRFLA